jgi:hypothetical protein
MTDAEKPKKLQRIPTRQCSHAMSFVTAIKIFESSTALEELENYSNCLQVDLQNLISPDDCIRGLPNDEYIYRSKGKNLRPTVLFETRVEILHCKLQVTNGVSTHVRLFWK